MTTAFPSLTKDEYRALLLIEEFGTITWIEGQDNSVDGVTIVSLIQLHLIHSIEPRCSEYTSTERAEIFYEKYYERQDKKRTRKCTETAPTGRS